MALVFCSFSSGSSGNCYLVRSERAAILVDAGISGRKILESLENAEVNPDEVKAVLITHEHHDHVRSIRTIDKRLPQIHTYANNGTWQSIEADIEEKKRMTFKTGEEFFIEDIKVRSFPLSHDATEPVGFSFYQDGKQISILTDTGFLSRDIYDEIKEADLLVLEANHDVDMLKIGRYPLFLKQRILGEKGHLSNVDAADAICRLLAYNEKRRHILLAHLSRENNFPEMAYQTIKNRLEENNYYIGENVRLNIIARDEMSALYTL